jgi:hypothetical protein
MFKLTLKMYSEKHLALSFKSNFLVKLGWLAPCIKGAKGICIHSVYTQEAALA